MNMLDVVKEIEKFSTTILSLGKPVDETIVKNFEEKYNLILPPDYKILLRKYDGIDLMGTGIYSIKKPTVSYTLEECYLFEHYEVENKMPLYLVPFSPDGGGNHYCFDTRQNNETSCLIVFWQHDYPYSEQDPPEVVNSSLADWIKEVMIDWTLEDYDYDGTPK